jgi:hypothetical protein
MERLNLVEIETPWGYRAFELYQGDITRLGHKVDVLAVSAFAGDYVPTRTSVIGALRNNCGISLQQLSLTPEFDMRQSLGCWVARPERNEWCERIVCLEMLGRHSSIGEALENLFAMLAVLEAKGLPVSSLALPVLGTGDQAIKPDLVIRELLRCALAHLKRSQLFNTFAKLSGREGNFRLMNTA